MEHVGIVAFLGLLAGAIIWAGNEFFQQGWGVGVFLLIWLIELVVVYGGSLILDGSDF